MASPFVAGEAALIHKQDGSLSASKIERKIRCSARSLVGVDLVYGAMLGAGHADVGASLKPIDDSACLL